MNLQTLKKSIYFLTEYINRRPVFLFHRGTDLELRSTTTITQVAILKIFILKDFILEICFSTKINCRFLKWQPE